MTNRETYKGPALFSYGFRPFFLSAALFAMLAIPMWWLVWRGDLALASRLNPVDWHIHEMIFGYGAAVVAGFLFTAVPNWTGRLPTRGGPLVVLLSFWIAGRVAVAGLTGQGPFVVALIDQLFLLAVTLMIAREIVAGRNWRNLKVLVPVMLLWLANILFHAEAAMLGTADHGRRLGIALLIFLVMLIGGRIVPSFTRNWLIQRGETRLPVGFSRFDALCLAAGAAGLTAWVVAPYTMICAALGAAAAVLHLVRVARWRGAGTWRSPLLLMLHIAYLMVPLGFAAVALAALGLVAPASGAHVLGIGAVGGMTVAVMMRATMGHTGRPLEAGRVLSGAFVLMIAAAAARVAGPAPIVVGVDGIDLSAFLWTCAFTLLVVRIGPWLLHPKVGRKVPRAAVRVAIHDQ